MMIAKKMAAPSFKTGAAQFTANTSLNYNTFLPVPLRGIAGYEKLRSEWINANPEHSELDLLTACAGFARACGLALREKVLADSIRELGGGNHEQRT